MADKTGISWTDATWNPIRGCSKVSAGCKNCYAEKVAARFSGPGQPYEGTTRDGKWNGNIRIVPEMLSQPLKWKRPRRVFVNSMSDLFHKGVPFEYIAAVFGVMTASARHTFQVLTKRPERAVEFFKWAERLWCPGWNDEKSAVIAVCRDADVYVGHMVGVLGRGCPWPLPNVHLGVSIEDQSTADERIPPLLQCPTAVRFVSYEPALGPVDFYGPGWFVDGPEGPGLNWIIVGGESGPSARPFDVAWARSTIAQCRAAGVACFVKQVGAHPWDGPGSLWGADPTMRSGVIRTADRAGADPAEWPEDLRVQEFPK